MVPVGALLAAGGSLTSDAYGWHPPGPLFLVFGFAVCAMVPGDAGDGPGRGWHSPAASALFSMLVAQVGVLREPASWAPPVLPVPRFRDALASPGAGTHLVRYVVALSVAGGLATALDWQHPYWAMVAAVVVLSGPDLLSRLTRGVQRVVGTLLGLGVAAVILQWGPQGVVAVLVIVVLQVLTELFVGRNYAVALLFITPLALLMGQLAHASPTVPLLRDRLLETVLGALVGAVVLLRRPRPLSTWASAPRRLGQLPMCSPLLRANRGVVGGRPPHRPPGGRHVRSPAPRRRGRSGRTRRCRPSPPVPRRDDGLPRPRRRRSCTSSVLRRTPSPTCSASSSTRMPSRTCRACTTRSSSSSTTRLPPSCERRAHPLPTLDGRQQAMARPGPRSRGWTRRSITQHWLDETIRSLSSTGCCAPSSPTRRRADPRTRALLVRGDAGVGKSALVDAVAEHCRALRLACAVGHCLDLATGMPSVRSWKRSGTCSTTATPTPRRSGPAPRLASGPRSMSASFESLVEAAEVLGRQSLRARHRGPPLG